MKLNQPGNREHRRIIGFAAYRSKFDKSAQKIVQARLKPDCKGETSIFKSLMNSGTNKILPSWYVHLYILFYVPLLLVALESCRKFVMAFQ